MNRKRFVIVQKYNLSNTQELQLKDYLAYEQ